VTQGDLRGTDTFIDDVESLIPLSILDHTFNETIDDALALAPELGDL